MSLCLLHCYAGVPTYASKFCQYWSSAECRETSCERPTVACGKPTFCFEAPSPQLCPGLCVLAADCAARLSFHAHSSQACHWLEIRTMVFWTLRLCIPLPLSWDFGVRPCMHTATSSGTSAPRPFLAHLFIAHYCSRNCNLCPHRHTSRAGRPARALCGLWLPCIARSSYSNTKDKKKNKDEKKKPRTKKKTKDEKKKPRTKKKKHQGRKKQNTKDGKNKTPEDEKKKHQRRKKKHTKDEKKKTKDGKNKTPRTEKNHQGRKKKTPEKKTPRTEKKTPRTKKKTPRDG